MSAKSNEKKEKHGHAAVNKKAFMNFEIVDKFEAGLSLLGTEVKSLRIGAADLSGSYARIDGDQCWLYGTSITQYQQAGARPHDPTRKRKLLLHKAEIRKIKIKLEQRGFTFVPLRIYFNDRGFAKVELGLAKGKRQYDKRKTITERDQKRDLDRNMKKYRK
ncbi:MAG: SsrA-binding protein SmpB [Sedimentisphaerales bacterium]|nr:SsrA-binding protein SmpB [Sedimentisphaerales bacterium]